MTTDGRPLRSVPIPVPPAASDGTHWLYFGEFTSSMPPGVITSSMQIGRTSSTRIMRTALDGSQREEAKFDAPYGWQSLQCGNGACLVVWPANGELWGALLRADRPLASARAQRFAAGKPVQYGVVAAARNTFLIVTGRTDGSVRAAIVSAKTGAVEREATVAVFPRGNPWSAHAGGGADGFEVVFEGSPMEAYRVGLDGSVRALGPIGDGSPIGVVRNDGQGYVFYQRRGDVFATITE